MGRLDGKVAVVTGAGKGIGRGIARRFAAEGAVVVVAELDEVAGKQVANDIETAGMRALFVRTDVGDEMQIEKAIATAVSAYGRLDVLVNNAITLSPNVPIEDKTDEGLDHQLRTGLWAAWWSMRAALPHFRKQGGGRVINFYSIDAEAAAWLHVDYNITKEAIRGLTRSAAVEWGRYNVLVNAIAPAAQGTVYEELSREIPGFAEMSAAQNPLGRVGDPYEDVAPVAVFLASDDSRYVTGEVIHVDGGQHLPRYNSKPQIL